MQSLVRPTKEQVRAWLAERRQAGLPPPDCEQIRRQLGWRAGASAEGEKGGPSLASAQVQIFYR